MLVSLRRNERRRNLWSALFKQGDAMQKLTTILHPTDFSDLAANALHVALALAQQHNAQLIVLYVKQPQEDVIGEFGMPPPEPEPSDEAILERLGKLIPAGSSVPARAMVINDTVVDGIVQVAKKTKADVIVMGTHGRKGLARLFHANIADHVTRAAPCKVLALRSAETEVEGEAIGS
jgi:nucleotide-binding universal stress UspA family protein